LIDEMFPPATCQRLTTLGHDAVHVRDRGLDARPDSEVAALAGQEARVLVTENVKDFAHCEGIVVVCALKSRLRAHDLAQDLATVLAAWASTNADPYVGLHWPFPPSGKRR
jgi:hypothetical protein